MEGIMLSHEYEDEIPLIDLAFFSEGFGKREMGLRERLHCCWRILREGRPYIDMVVLNKEMAKELGTDLLAWGKYEPIKGQNIEKMANEIQGKLYPNKAKKRDKKNAKDRNKKD